MEIISSIHRFERLFTPRRAPPPAIAIVLIRHLVRSSSLALGVLRSMTEESAAKLCITIISGSRRCIAPSASRELIASSMIRHRHCHQIATGLRTIRDKV